MVETNLPILLLKTNILFPYNEIRVEVTSSKAFSTGSSKVELEKVANNPNTPNKTNIPPKNIKI